MDLMQMVDRANNAQLFQNLSPPVQITRCSDPRIRPGGVDDSYLLYAQFIIVLSFVRQGWLRNRHRPIWSLRGWHLLTMFIMQPTIDDIGQKAVNPFLNKQIMRTEAVSNGVDCLQKFMLRQTRKQRCRPFPGNVGQVQRLGAGTDSLSGTCSRVCHQRAEDGFHHGLLRFTCRFYGRPRRVERADVDGYGDDAAALISAPFKVLLFVLADGWHLIAAAITLSFSYGGFACESMVSRSGLQKGEITMGGEENVLEFSRDLFYTAMLVALPAMAVSLVVGLIVGVFSKP